MITSSGSASSRMRGRSPSVLPRTRTPSIRRRRLLGSSSTKPTGVRPEPAVAHDLAQHQAPAVAGAGDQHAALALAPAAKGRQRAALVHAARERAHAHQQHQREQREQHDHAVGQRDRRPCCGSGAPGATPRSPRPPAARSPRPRARPPRSRAGPSSASGAGRRAPARAPAGSPRAPTRSCVRAGARSSRVGPLLEAQLEGEVVRERDQHPVHRELGQRVTVQGKGRRADPSAHWQDCKRLRALRRLGACRATASAAAPPARRGSRRTRLARRRRARARPSSSSSAAPRRRMRPSAISRSSTAPGRPSKVVYTGTPSATASRFIVPPAEITRSA